MNILSSLFMDELARCQSGKHLQRVSLTRIAMASNCPQVQSLIQSHLQKTEYQLQKLRCVLATCGREPPEKRCDVTSAILKDCHRIAVEFKDTPALKVALARRLQRIEYGEASVYACLLEWALLLDNEKASGLLKQLINHANIPAPSLVELAILRSNPRSPSNPEHGGATSDRFGHLVRLTA